MMKKILSILPALCLPVLLASCTGQTDESAGLEIFADKTVISADGKDAVTFTVTDNAADVTQEAVIYCADDNSAVFPGTGISGIRRIFPGSDREVLTKSSGSDYRYHRWFKVTFDDSESLVRMSETLAGRPDIQGVQYNTIVYPAVEPQVYPYQGAGARISSSAVATGQSPVFNDPGLADQWHYSNDGSVCRTAREGADINVLDAWRLTGGDFDLYQKIGEGRYRLKYGSYTVTGTQVSGTYSGEIPWGSQYEAAVNGNTLVLTATNASGEVCTYEKESIPASVISDAVELRSSGDSVSKEGWL